MCGRRRGVAAAAARAERCAAHAAAIPCGRQHRQQPSQQPPESSIHAHRDSVRGDPVATCWSVKVEGLRRALGGTAAEPSPRHRANGTKRP